MAQKETKYLVGRMVENIEIDIMGFNRSNVLKRYDLLRQQMNQYE